MNSICPVCENLIPADRILSGNAYCPCGNVMRSQQQIKKETLRMSAPVVVFSILFIGAIIHGINWDKYFFTIIPLKMMQMISVSSAADLKQIAKICNARKKTNCEVEAYEQAFDVDHKETDGLNAAADIHFINKKYNLALRDYTQYFLNGGKSIDARLKYAQVLAELNSIPEAKKQYDYLLLIDTKNSKFDVARAYVELLVKHKDYVTAKNIILRYRRADANSSMFLQKEWKTVTNTSDNSKNTSETNLARVKKGNLKI
ncbi:MAG: hypothetical protein ABL927_05885 [Bdellovibrionales bacterium]